MPKLIKNWKELSKVPANDKYKIIVDLDMGCGWIRPIKETKETKENYFKHHKYLTTHTFYSEDYKYSTKILQKYGFDVELENWGQVKERNNMCEYCEKDRTNLYKDECNSHTVEINMIAFPNEIFRIGIDLYCDYSGTSFTDFIDINYCPMCGRKLEGKE